MSKTGCLVSNSFILSLSICLHFHPHRVRPHLHRPGPRQLHLPWSLSAHSYLPACPLRSSHQRAPVSTFLRSSGSLVLSPHLHPQCAFLRVGPLFLTLAYTARQDLLLSLLCPHLLSPHGCFSNTPGKVLLPGLCMDCSLSWDYCQPRHRDG